MKIEACSGVFTLLALGALAPPALAQCEITKLTASDAQCVDQFGDVVALSGTTALAGAAHDDGATGAAYVFELTPPGWVETAKLTASDAEIGDAFGFSVAVSGDTALVGSLYDDDAASGAGAAYVFDRTPSGWVETAKLTASDGAPNDHFGWSASISGERALIGAHDVNGLAGAAYIFDRTPSGWVETAKLTASDGASADLFGFSVSLSGDTALVGAYLDDDACPAYPNCQSGSAYVFEYTGSAWVETAKLTASDAAEKDNFGFSVSISGDKALVGAHCDDDAGSCSGSVYVFERSQSGVWGPNETAKLTASDAAALDLFGSSVSLSGDVAAIGAHGDDDAGNNAGSAYVFEHTPSGWVEKGKLVASDGENSDLFGLPLAISGDTVVVGSRGGDDACPSDPNCSSGSAYIFTIQGPLGRNYCSPAVPNSSGLPAVIEACGSTEVAENYVVIRGTNLPLNQFGFFLASETQGFVQNPGGSQGNLCLGGTIGRFVQQVRHSGPAGTFSIFVDLASIPISPPHSVLPGETWNFEAWFRDKNPGPTSNFTDGVSVLFR